MNTYFCLTTKVQYPWNSFSIWFSSASWVLFFIPWTLALLLFDAAILKNYAYVFDQDTPFHSKSIPPWRIPTEEKQIFLTFDDGPVPEVTPWVLEQLKQYNAKATFFCVGDNISKHPEVFQK